MGGGKPATRYSGEVGVRQWRTWGGTTPIGDLTAPSEI